MEDSKIIDLFIGRNQQALREIDTKYGKLCHSIANNILKDKSDAEECVNDAYLGVWNTIPPQKPDFLRAYICKIVRNISLKCYYSKTTAKRNSVCDVVIDELENVLASPNTVEQSIDAKELASIINEFMNELSEENRFIFMRRYWFLDNYAIIAERVGLTENTVSVRLTRIRKQLKEYLAEREVYV